MIGPNGLFAVLAFALIVAVIDAQRIVGGTPAYPGELPYQVSLRYQGRHHCGGAIISKRHILTAASCVKYVANFNNAVIVTGSVNLNTGQTHRIKRVLYHSDWKENVSGIPNDIAIIALFREIAFTYYQNKINLPYAPTSSRAIATVSGWGGTRNNPYGSQPNLSKAQVRTLSASECHAILGYSSIIWTHQICTYSAAGVGICLGDGGGPLAYNGQLIGIVSWGFHCGLGYPDVYSSVYHYLKWINHHLNTT